MAKSADEARAAAMKPKRGLPKGGGKGLKGSNLYTPVSQATIDSIKKAGMAASLKKAATSTDASYVQGVRRMYGAERLAAAKKSVKPVAKSADAARAGSMKPVKPVAKSADAARMSATKTSATKPAVKKSGTTGTSMVLLGSASASSSATIDFTGLALSDYSGYRILLDCVVPATNGVSLLMRTSSSGTFQTSGYYWQNWRWTTSGSGVTGNAGSATGIALDASGADNMANTANQGGNWVIDINVPFQSTDIHKVTYQGFYVGSTWLGVVGGGYTGTNSIDGIRFLMTSGNISTGRFYLYGIKED